MDYTKMRRADRALRREAALETIDRCTFDTLGAGEAALRISTTSGNVELAPLA